MLKTLYVSALCATLETRVRNGAVLTRDVTRPLAVVTHIHIQSYNFLLCIFILNQQLVLDLVVDNLHDFLEEVGEMNLGLVKL